MKAGELCNNLGLNFYECHEGRKKKERAFFCCHAGSFSLLSDSEYKFHL